MGLEPSWNGDIALASLQPPASFPELYEELWWYSGATESTNATGPQTAGLQRGGPTSGLTGNPPFQLFGSTNSWKATQQFAFEATIYNSTSGGTTYAEMWDLTSNVAVLNSQISTTSNTAVVVRSSEFTLTQGHNYGVTWWSSNSADTAYITDASLIIFPPSPSVSPSLSSIGLANPSGNTLKEAYIPLWMYSSGGATDASASSGLSWLQKGSTGTTTTSSSSAIRLFTLSSNWSSSQKFAFESSLYTNVSNAAQAQLWDFTSSQAVLGSSVSTTSTTMTLIRSGLFTLVPSHVYGINAWNGSGTTFISKAYLVALAN